jgi:FMN phosphatase YigB (HAD superfamily)
MNNKVILVDCDGVLLDWEYAFHAWMKRHGYTLVNSDVYDMAHAYNMEKSDVKRLIRIFNESAVIRKLPPLRDAMKYVKKLHEEHGYVFHAITSLSNDQYAQHLRTKNLIELFGPTVFEKYTYLDTGADKDEALAEYADTECVWVEDKPENAVVGANLGLNCYLMTHGHNDDFEHPFVTKVNCWKDIYHSIV